MFFHPPAVTGGQTENLDLHPDLALMGKSYRQSGVKRRTAETRFKQNLESYIPKCPGFKDLKLNGEKIIKRQ